MAAQAESGRTVMGTKFKEWLALGSIIVVVFGGAIGAMQWIVSASGKALHLEIQRSMQDGFDTIRADVQTADQGLLEKMQEGFDTIRADMQAADQATNEKMQAADQALLEKMQDGFDTIRVDMQTADQALLEKMQAADQALLEKMQAGFDTIRVDMQAADQALLEKMQAGFDTIRADMQAADQATNEKMQAGFDAIRIELTGIREHLGWLSGRTEGMIGQSPPRSPGTTISAGLSNVRSLVEKLLEAGVSWEVIEAVTGLDESRYQAFIQLR